ncbi:hypothetical protein ANANG_G00125750 [Anguilla anguilla]|uniref:CASAMP N-terminal domain-containing protein n=1 Tax=Anguilla anguilla TaxID=7936 RepID=A0A9D3RY08_ANGAN|nr:hypothetical protein ANANG_G00125750 [Anguilla anguilla]
MAGGQSLWDRQCPGGSEGAVLHGPVQPGAHQAAGGEPAAVGGAVLPGREPHPEERRRQAAPGARRRHPGAGAEGPVRHRPGAARHREGPLQRPIKMSAHLAMIDTLMMAYTAEMVSLERVVSCLQKYRPLDAEDDVPYDTEEAVTSWINKVNEYLKDIIAQEQKIGEAWSEDPAGPRIRIQSCQLNEWNTGEI